MVKQSIFISYPKSGRTWVRYILKLAGIRLEFTHAGTSSGRQELGCAFPGVDESLCKTCDPVFMHRNPIDTAVAFFFQVHKRELVPGTGRYYRQFAGYALADRWPPSQMAEFMMHPSYGVEKVCRFNRAWLDHLAAHPNKLVFTYEDMSTKGRETIGDLLAFVGGDTGMAAELFERSSFEEMKRIEATGREGSYLSVCVAGDPESAKVRRGKVRGYVNYLDAATIKACREVAAAYGFDA